MHASWRRPCLPARQKRLPASWAYRRSGWASLCRALPYRVSLSHQQQPCYASPLRQAVSHHARPERASCACPAPRIHNEPPEPAGCRPSAQSLAAHRTFGWSPAARRPGGQSSFLRRPGILAFAAPQIDYWSPFLQPLGSRTPGVQFGQTECRVFPSRK